MINWVKLGDANTTYFHAKSIVSHRHNFIASLKNDEQLEITDHDGKAAVLWLAFKEKMGKSESTVMHFDLPSLYGQNVDVGLFHQLEVPFSDEEIEGVVKELPNDKSPGPDGFNNDFIKHCWQIVGKDIKDLIRAFYDENICMKA